MSTLSQAVLVTRPQLASALNISPSFVTKLQKQGLPFTRLGSAVRYDIARVLAWLEKTQERASA